MNTPHQFRITEIDEYGREFGYCSICGRDMQNLKNGESVKTYNTHKRAKSHGFAYWFNANPHAAWIETPEACHRDTRRAPLRECHKGALIGEKATPEQIRLWQSLGIIR